jgi:hypothetical protein
MSVKFPLTQSRPVYISRILTPSCFFLRNLDEFAEAEPTGSRVGRRAMLGVLDLLGNRRGFGVRDTELQVVWKA